MEKIKNEKLRLEKERQSSIETLEKLKSGKPLINVNNPYEI